MRRVGSRCYPLSTGELSGLTGMSKRQVQYWSERRLQPHWLDERGHRRFEAAAVIVAFALSDSKQQGEVECPRFCGHLNAWVRRTRQEGCGVHATQSSPLPGGVPS